MVKALNEGTHVANCNDHGSGFALHDSSERDLRPSIIHCKLMTASDLPGVPKPRPSAPASAPPPASKERTCLTASSRSPAPHPFGPCPPAP